MSPATAELQRWGEGDGGGGGGGRGGGGETQCAHAAHLPASDREGRALVARAVHAQRCARVRAAAHRRCCSPPACRSFGTRASEGHRGASACKRSGPRTQGPARQPASRAPELARRRLPAQAAARGPLFGPRRSRTTCTCSAGSDPTRVKEEAPEPNCEGLCSRRQKGRPGPGRPRLTHAALQYFLSHGTSWRSPRHSHRPPPWKCRCAEAADAQVAAVEVATCTQGRRGTCTSCRSETGRTTTSTARSCCLPSGSTRRLQLQQWAGAPRTPQRAARTRTAYGRAPRAPG